MTVSSRKGGVGKTATAVNLAIALRDAGRRVVVVDLDPQGDASSELGVTLTDTSQTIAEVLRGDASVQDAVVDVGERLAVLPADRALDDVDDEALGGAGTVGKALSALLLNLAQAGWDLAILDTHPDRSAVALGALAISDVVLVPISAQTAHSVRNTDLVTESLEQIAPAAAVRFLIVREQPARRDGLFRRRTARAVDQSAAHHLGDRLLETRIVESAAMHDATVSGVPVSAASPDSLVADQYRRTARELLPLLTEDHDAS